MGHGEIDGLRGFQIERGVVLAGRAAQHESAAGNGGIALEGVVHLGVIGQAEAGARVQLEEHAGIEAEGGIVTLDLHLAVVAAQGQRVEHGGGQFAVDTVDGWAEADGKLVVDAVADGRLQGDHAHFAAVAEVAAGEAAFVVGDQAERHVDAQAEGPFVIQRLDVIAHGHAHGGDHVTVVAAAKGTAGVIDVGPGEDQGGTGADLLALDARHAGRVAEYGGGVIGRRGATGECGAHAADALFVDGEAGCQAVAGSGADGQGEGGLEDSADHGELLKVLQRVGTLSGFRRPFQLRKDGKNAV
ncbi:hypothetical protein D9M68_565590 [compost metagenome]